MTHEPSSRPVSLHATCCRRAFLGGALGCGAYTLLALAGAPGIVRKSFAQVLHGERVKETAFARIERLAEGVWAVISTPEGGFTTVSNGGIVAGKEGVLAIEGFMSAAGGSWLREAAKELTGRYPTHVALTHFHADHIAGLSGYMTGEADPQIVATAATRAALPPELRSGSSVIEVGASEPMAIDLGGRSVRFVPHRGHTPSDVTVELEDPQLIWCGDLLWNGLFPNYMDAIPSALSETCAALLGDAGTTYVPGHGSIGDAAMLSNYQAMLNHIGEAARAAHAAGTPASEAAKTYTVPASLGAWALFEPTYYEVAFEAWARELKAK